MYLQILLVILVLLLIWSFVSVRSKEKYDTLPFSGKTILITGGTSGIGLATAKAFSNAGASRVVVCGRTTEKWNNAKQTLNNNQRKVIEYYQCDVRIEDQVKRMIESIDKFHVAFNNAGVASGTVITEQTLQNSENSTDILYSLSKKNCLPGTTDPTSTTCENPIFTDGMGLLYCLKYEITQMRKNNIHGAIVNTASVNSIWGAPGEAIYSMAKGMVQMLTKSAGSYEVSQKDKVPIRINCIAPGPVDTPLVRNQFPKGTKTETIQKDASAGVPLGRMAQPEEIAPTVLFLSDNNSSSYITGATFVIDGGLTASPILS